MKSISFSLALLISAQVTQLPSGAAALSDNANGSFISLESKRPCEACGFIATIGLGSAKRVFQIRSTIKDLSSARIINSQVAILVGKYNDFASWVTLFDLSSGKTVIDAPAYFPSISPDAHYLVFVRFFPEHPVTNESTSNVVELLDLRKISPLDIFRTNVLPGSTLYPNPPDDQYHSVQAGFVWHGSDDFTFEDLVMGYTYLVNASLHGDSASVVRLKMNKPRRPDFGSTY